MTTGQRIKERRKQLGISAEKLADMLNVSPATIYRYENGDIEKVPGERLAPIADALSTTPAALMGWENVYSTDELIDLYIRGAKKWSTDFRFSKEQRTRISEYLAESTAKLKQVINAMAESSQSDGKILMNSALQSALDSLTYWSANAVKYVNEDFANEPYEGMLLELFRQIPENRQPLVFGMIRAAIEADQETKGSRE